MIRYEPMPFHTSRPIPAPPAEVFSAFADVARLARWWGPAGFTNTFRTFEFQPEGRRPFMMHGPDGTNYPNEIVMNEIEAPQRIVVRHVSQPHYLLTVTLDATPDGGTLVTWQQAFENPEVERRMQNIIETANEQLLERLSAEVMRTHGH